MKRSHKNAKRFRGLKILICIFLLIVGVLYIMIEVSNRNRISNTGITLNALYVPSTRAPMPTDIEVPATEIPRPSEAPTETPEAVEVFVPTEEPATPAPTYTPAPTEEPVDIPMIDDELLPTPTVMVLALPTAPPTQYSFKKLLDLNMDTVAFLRVGEKITLPVVQKRYDNEFYLDHDFYGNEAKEGSLFLDGMNLLVPCDDCLVIYGHNMRNGTMFGVLKKYLEPERFREIGIVNFDTIYENGEYVPFAALNVSVDPDSKNYIDIRNFLLTDEDSFDLFTLRLKAQAKVTTKVDLKFGDRLLLLVTCDPKKESARNVLALRRLREDEDPALMNVLVENAIG